ncbi:Aspartyl protease family protein 1 [Linum perenne]
MQFPFGFPLGFMKSSIFFLASCLILLISSTCSCNGRIFSFEMHHRYSDTYKNWSTRGKKSLHFPPQKWPEEGSFEYYAALARRDHFLRGRRLSDDSPLAFADGNSTFRLSSLGFLHYTTVELGTPGVKFMVALDTGSDLFWVPCQCSRCAPTEGSAYASQQDFELNIYNPSESSTSKRVTCNDDLCTHRNRCFETLSNCPYTVSYVSAQTSTSGILVQDLLHLTTEGSYSDVVEAPVTFGCGQVQSGSFLDIAAPNGLFGLGMEKISVPSTLSREGLISDSFSMCFGRDGVGRISFGDKGSPDQEETPFNLNPSHPTYNITVSRVRVGTTLIDAEDITALFDSGTSFTYLVNPIYTRITESFHSQARDSRRAPDSRIPFEYCYNMSPDASASLIPSMTLTMKGGNHYIVYDPIIVISTQGELVYCLAIVKSAELNIIGQNFMTGYRIVFDRERLVLGWKKFDCYDVEEYTNVAVEPGTSMGFQNNLTSEEEKESDNPDTSASIHVYIIEQRVSLLFLMLMMMLDSR